MRGSSLDKEALDLEANIASQRNLSRKNSALSARDGDHPMMPPPQQGDGNFFV